MGDGQNQQMAGWPARRQGAILRHMVDEPETFPPVQPLTGGLDDLRAFCAVVELGTLTAAARLLGETKGGISRRVQRLETHLGARLLARSPRAVAPTEEGQRFYQGVREALACLDEAAETARQTRQGVAGLIRLTAPVDLAALVLPPLLVRFQQRYPLVRLDVIGADTALDLTAHRLDLALRIGLQPLPDVSYTALPLGWLGIALYAAPSYLETRGGVPTPETLASHALILAGPFRAAASLTLACGPARQIIPVRAQTLAADFACALRFAEAGGGIAPLPTLVAAEALAADRLRPVLPAWHLGAARLYALTQEGRDGPARLRALVAFLQQELAGLGARAGSTDPGGPGAP